MFNRIVAVNVFMQGAIRYSVKKQVQFILVCEGALQLNNCRVVEVLQHVLLNERLMKLILKLDLLLIYDLQRENALNALIGLIF